MSWNIEVTGADKSETLSAFNDAVDKDQHCKPKDAVKGAASLLTEHMGEESVSKVRSYGHTNDDGEQCNAAVLINC